MNKLLAISLICFLFLVVIGCNNSRMAIRIVNKSGSDLKNLVCSANGKSFEIAFFADDDFKGIMTAEMFLGHEVPEKLKLTFENSDGKKFEREVSFGSENKSRKINLEINSEFEVNSVPWPTEKSAAKKASEQTNN